MFEVCSNGAARGVNSYGEKQEVRKEYGGLNE
jgi:hypothetical protein